MPGNDNKILLYLVVIRIYFPFVFNIGVLCGMFVILEMFIILPLKLNTKCNKINLWSSLIQNIF